MRKAFGKILENVFFFFFWWHCIFKLFKIYSHALDVKNLAIFLKNSSVKLIKKTIVENISI